MAPYFDRLPPFDNRHPLVPRDWRSSPIPATKNLTLFPGFDENRADHMALLSGALKYWTVGYPHGPREHYTTTAPDMFVLNPLQRSTINVLAEIVHADTVMGEVLKDFLEAPVPSLGIGYGFPVAAAKMVLFAGRLVKEGQDGVQSGSIARYRAAVAEWEWIMEKSSAPVTSQEAIAEWNRFKKCLADRRAAALEHWMQQKGKDDDDDDDEVKIKKEDLDDRDNGGSGAGGWSGGGKDRHEKRGARESWGSSGGTSASKAIKPERSTGGFGY